MIVPPHIARAIDEALDGNDMARAVREAKLAIDAGYAHPMLFHLRAVSRKQSGDLEGARRDLEAALALAPDSAALLIETADCLNALGEHERAIALCGEAIAHDHGQPVAWYQKGYGHQILGQFERAQRSFAEAVRLDPNYAGAHARLALIASGQNRNEEARTHAARALALDPRNGIARLALGAADLADGKLADAAPNFEAVAVDPLAQAPERAVATAQLGDVCHAMGRMDEAFEAYRNAGAIWKDYYGPHVLKPGIEPAAAQLGRLIEGLAALSADR
jgi:tetratricopeptide (TPR) repeat protein